MNLNLYRRERRNFNFFRAANNAGRRLFKVVDINNSKKLFHPYHFDFLFSPTSEKDFGLVLVFEATSKLILVFLCLDWKVSFMTIDFNRNLFYIPDKRQKQPTNSPMND